MLPTFLTAQRYFPLARKLATTAELLAERFCAVEKGSKTVIKVALLNIYFLKLFLINGFTI